MKIQLFPYLFSQYRHIVSRKDLNIEHTISLSSRLFPRRPTFLKKKHHTAVAIWCATHFFTFKFGDVISSGRIHSSNCSSVTSPVSSAASLSDEPV